MPRDLTPQEAADYLAKHEIKVSAKTLRRWGENGTVKCYALPGGGHKRFRVADLDDFILDFMREHRVSQIDLPKCSTLPASDVRQIPLRDRKGGIIVGYALVHKDDLESVSPYEWRKVKRRLKRRKIPSRQTLEKCTAAATIDGNQVALHRFVRSVPEHLNAVALDGNYLNCTRGNIITSEDSRVLPAELVFKDPRDRREIE